MLSFDQNMLTVMFAVFFLVIFLFIFGFMRYFNMRQQKKEMVEKIKGDGFSEYKEIFDQDAESVLSQSQETRSGLVKVFDFLGRLFIGQAKTKSTSERKKFLRAGLRNKNAETAFWGAKIILPFIYLGVFIVLKATVLESMDMTRTLLILVVGSLFVFYLPDIWIKQITDKRKERLLKALPDSLDLLVVCVEAGMGLDGAIKRVGDEMELGAPDLSSELHLLNLEMRAGKLRKDALRNFAIRTDLDEIKSLVTLLIQSDRFGTSITDALKVFSESFRTQRFQRAEEKAAKLPVTILIPLILFIFPALFVVILGPAAINIYEQLLK